MTRLLFLWRNFRRALAFAAVEIDELFGLGHIADDVEFTDSFLFRRFKRRSGAGEMFALADRLAPQTVVGEKFLGVRVFDENVHGQAA